MDVLEKGCVKKQSAHAFLLTTAAKALASDELTSHGTTATVRGESETIAALHRPPGLRIRKRSRKGKIRWISLCITVEPRGMFLYWFSLFGMVKKKFSVSTLCEVLEMSSIAEGTSYESPNTLFVRLSNSDRSLDLLPTTGSDAKDISAFFRGFKS